MIINERDTPLSKKSFKGRVLLLGGTSFSLRIAKAIDLNLCITKEQLVYSLKGTTDNAILPNCQIRTGGFGGIDNMASWLCDNKITHLLDTTHRHATKISHHGATAAAIANVAYSFIRPNLWRLPKNLRIHYAENPCEAIQLAAQESQTIFLTHGTQALETVAAFHTKRFIARCASYSNFQKPDLQIANLQMIIEKGPFTFSNEKKLFQTILPDILVAKAGDGLLPNKLKLANKFNIPVILVKHPLARNLHASDKPKQYPMPKQQSIAQIIRWITSTAI